MSLYYLRSGYLLFLLLMIALTSSCTVSEASEPIPVATSASNLSPLPLTPESTAQNSPTAQPQSVTSSPTPLPPTTAAPTPTDTVQAPSVIVDSSCRNLEPPLLYIPINSIHQFIDPLNEQECHVSFQNADFSFGILWGENGFYGTLLQESGALELVHITFDGDIQSLLTIPHGYYQGNIVMSGDGQSLAWSNSGGPGDQFLTELWIANSDGTNPRKIHELAISPDDIYGQVINPIGFDEKGGVLYSIEPNGRGGGWAYVGIYSNLNRADIESGVSIELFSCDEITGPFCINSFSPEFRLYSYTSFQDKTVNIIELGSAKLISSHTVSEHNFVGLPVFNLQGDLALMSVEVVEHGNSLEPEDGQIGILKGNYESALEWLPAETISFLVGWLDNSHLLYTSLADDHNSTFIVINSRGEVVREFAMPTASYRLVQNRP